MLLISLYSWWIKSLRISFIWLFPTNIKQFFLFVFFRLVTSSEKFLLWKGHILVSEVCQAVVEQCFCVWSVHKRHQVPHQSSKSTFVGTFFPGSSVFCVICYGQKPFSEGLFCDAFMCPSISCFIYIQHLFSHWRQMTCQALSTANPYNTTHLFTAEVFFL